MHVKQEQIQNLRKFLNALCKKRELVHIQKLEVTFMRLLTHLIIFLKTWIFLAILTST